MRVVRASGKAVANYLLVGAADGHGAVSASPEADPAFAQRVDPLAGKRGGTALAPGDGPLRVIVGDEKRHARRVRQVVSLTIRKSD